MLADGGRGSDRSAEKLQGDFNLVIAWWRRRGTCVHV